ncbi:MAG: hypothetical protein DMG49_12045 [Acidobacteria bacterium]|nr:MAG: hypothetical protein DMG49_12045 [Acidobacteriota bacterium]
MGNVGVHDCPKISHPRRDKTPNVAKFGAKRIRVGIEEPRGDLADLAFAVGFVFARAAWPEGRGPISITPTFTRAIHFRFAVPRETNRTEHDSAFVAHFSSEAAVIREKLAALLDG